MGKSGRNVKAMLGHRVEHQPKVLPVGRRPQADVDGDVVDGSANHRDQLALLVGRCLKVQATQHAALAHAFVVLYKVGHARRQQIPAKGFKKVTTIVPKNTGFEQN